MTESRLPIYVLSAAVGVVGGVFSMMMFLFSYSNQHAMLDQRLTDHLEEWREFYTESVAREKDCEDERKELIKMVYDIREKLLTIDGKRNLP